MRHAVVLVSCAWLSSCAVIAPSVDAGPHDAIVVRDAWRMPHDANLPDAYVAPITVILRDPLHAPVVGSPVAFHDSAGALVDVVFTDASGMVSITPRNVAMLTVSLPYRATTPSYYYFDSLVTLTGVVPGGTYTFDPPVSLRRVTPPPALVGASQLFVCGGGWCTEDDLAAPTAVWDAADVTSLMAMTWSSPSPTAAYSFSIGAAGAADVTLGPWQSDCDVIPYDAIGVAGPIGRQLGVGATLDAPAGGVGIDLGVHFSAADTLELPRGLPTAFPVFAIADESVTHYSTMRRHVEVRITGMEGPAGITLDLGAAPAIGLARFDLATRAASIDPALPGALSSLGVEYANRNASNTVWVVYAAAPASSFVLPTLPVELAALDRSDPMMAVSWWVATGDFVDGVDYASFARAPLARGDWYRNWSSFEWSTP